MKGYALKVEKCLLVSFVINFFLGLMKTIVGVIGTSSALIVDGVHSFIDLFNDVVALLGSFVSKKRPSKKYPFGYGKTEYITSLIMGVIIVFLGLFLIKEMLFNKLQIPTKMVIFASLITVILKLFLSSFLLKKASKYNNNILLASGNESRVDVFSSFLVLISAIIIQFKERYSFLMYSDKMVSILIGLFIVFLGLRVIKLNISMIIGERFYDEGYLIDIDMIINSEKRIKGYDDLIIIKNGPFYMLDVKIIVSKDITVFDGEKIINHIKNALRTYDEKIRYINICLKT